MQKKINRDAARADGITLIHLFEIERPDAGVLRITGDVTTSIGFGGVTYISVPLEASGFSWNSKASPTHPLLTLTHPQGLFGSRFNDGGLQGAKVTRIVTFSSECDPPVGEAAVLASPLNAGRWNGSRGLMVIR